VWCGCAGGFQWQYQDGAGGQAWSVEEIMQHFFGGRGGAGGFGGGGNIFTSAAVMMDVPLRLTFMVRYWNLNAMRSVPVICSATHVWACC
jgi:hypothetical protein